MMVDKYRMNPDGAGNEVPAEQNHNLREENKEIGEWSGGEEQRGSEEGESRINDAAEDVRDDAALPGEQLVLLQRQQPPPPPILGAVVRWERLLPVRSLNVLLVENDDSTRQLVCALLRNCSYEVTAVADGIQAWNLLEAMEQRIHLVLTEVIMPCLSGIGLLSKIMSHRSCKHIPVIMMSSNDSMAMVLRCLSKGAVDFLVKPIRKNELKNLWQHVWRRCHSSSGSRSESGVQNQKTIKSKNTDDSDNNTGSNDEEDNGSFGLNFRDGSDHGSGTQSSWTKRAVEDGSPQLISTSNQLADPQDSTCAQDIYPKFEVFFNKSVPSISRECQEPKEFSDKNFIGEDLEMSLYSNPDGKHVNNTSKKVYAAPRGPRMDKLPGCIRKTDIDDCVPGLDSSNASCGPTAKVANLIGDMTTNSDTQMGSRVTEIADGFTKTLKCKDKFPEDLRESPSLELSLKRSRSLGDGDDHNVLGHSDLSAFSRYNNSAASTHPSRGYVGSCSSPHDLSEAKAEPTCRVLHTSTSKQGSHGSGSNNDKGSTTKDVLTKLVPSKEKMVSSSSIKNVRPLALHPVSHVPSTMQPIMQENVDDASLAGISGQPRTVQHQVQVQHHHHHYHHHHYHVHGTEQQRPQADHDDMALKNMAAAAPQCGSSNVPPGPLQGNAANYSLNGSGSGSNQGSNGPNGSSIAVDARGMNLENDTGVAATCEPGGGPSGVDQNRVSQREVALNKFRLKRKERNFEKKVRYQSRKRLAEQRPRVRGQFVRRTTSPDSGS